ncbi:tryptophan-rich sensory protein [Clostridium sp. MSJ-11]|uniref:Tryptophan-rich sensory protein n=1 Tax=Clostridium mobile TaxID=2841512 RepID=A0ABS6EC55_9CLOT|nr:TspO/MBR family protein [Clostridium mobile]MBU5482712.1 tryptophan-rich sensory protein [Clostridium mobile]
MVNIFKVKDKKNIGLLILTIILTEGVGFLSGFLGMYNKETYEKLIRPSFSPPVWVFPIIWVVLYFLMAVAFFRILLRRKEGKNIKKAVTYYIIQLALNFLWTIIFFRFNLYGLAFIELLILLAFILLTTFEFYKHDKVSAFLMIPYILWVSFAGVLNFAIWALNEM